MQGCAVVRGELGVDELLGFLARDLSWRGVDVWAVLVFVGVWSEMYNLTWQGVMGFANERNFEVDWGLNL